MNVGTLYELLDRLPERCDYFTVRFTLHDRSEWIQPECFHIDDDGDLILTIWSKDEGPDKVNVFTVDRLKKLLDGYWNDTEDDEDEMVFNWRDIYVMGKDYDEYSDEEDTTYYDILNHMFSINWKRGRVDIFIDYN